MELHHINTGRGNAGFYIFPDGTTMLVDAGDMSETHPEPHQAETQRCTQIVPKRLLNGL